MVLVQILRGEVNCPWNLFYYIQNIKSVLSSFSCVVAHIFREGNKSADGLANEAMDRRDSQVFYNLKDLPKHIQGAIVLDGAGMPSFRL